MRFTGILVLSLLATITVGQEPKPEEKPKPTEIKLSELPEVDQLKIQNLYLRLDGLRSEIRRLQTEAAVIEQDRLPALITQIETRKEFEGYKFDFNSVSLKLKK